MKVAVLGCGPAGLMAAMAIKLNGDTPVIFSKKRKSHLFGAQYLHAPIPGVTDREDHVTVEYMLRGHVDDYRRKVYGNNWDGTVSPEDLSDDHEAWDIRETYDRLWTMFESSILDFAIDPIAVAALDKDREHQLIVNTIPLNELCRQGHQFRGTEIVAAGDAPELGVNVGQYYHCPPDTVICNGEDSPTWYRISNIFGHTTVEWPSDINPPLTSCARVTKPTSTNCDCWPHILNVGRYGSWTKGVLSHTAFVKTQERLGNGSSAEASSDIDATMPTLF